VSCTSTSKYDKRPPGFLLSLMGSVVASSGPHSIQRKCTAYIAHGFLQDSPTLLVGHKIDSPCVRIIIFENVFLNKDVTTFDSPLES
jgi:hypothetical protein